MVKTPIKAIREKCLDCSGGSIKEVEYCPVVNCSLLPYRFGMRPDTAAAKGKSIKHLLDPLDPLATKPDRITAQQEDHQEDQ